MSHHYSGPNFGFPRGDARIDITDLFAFPSPGNPGKSIVIMDVHPSHTAIPVEPTTPEPFSPDAIYELKIDTDGDVVPNIAYRMRFTSTNGGAQTAIVRRADGAQAAGTGDDGQVIIDRAPVSTGRDASVTTAGDYRFFAGWRSDPFFFDTLGALDNFKFTGADFFTGKDVCSIVLEMPNAALGGTKISLWHRSVARVGDTWIQADRGARPSQSIFLTGDQEAAYQSAQPADDARFVPVFAHTLEHTGGFTPGDATRVAKTLLPDILCYDPTRPAKYPDNGRALTDDVMDIFIRTVTNGNVTGDGVGAHHDLLSDFPYVGPPHKVRTPELVPA